MILFLQIYCSWRSSIVNWWFFFCFGVLDLYFYLSTKTPFSRIKSDIGGKHLLTLIKNSLEFIKAVLEKSFMTSGNFYNWTWVLWSFNFEKYSYQISKTPPSCPGHRLIIFLLSENAIVLFFLMEYLVRFICSPRKWRFFKQPMNLVDFFAIIPFMLDLVIGGLQVCDLLSSMPLKLIKHLLSIIFLPSILWILILI